MYDTMGWIRKLQTFLDPSEEKSKPSGFNVRSVETSNTICGFAVLLSLIQYNQLVKHQKGQARVECPTAITLWRTGGQH